MDADVHELIQQIHASPRKAALAATGGGATAAAWLLAVPGGSRTVLEAAVPYAQVALEEYLGREPASYCSAPAARAMALRARERAAHLAPEENVVGVACTASLRWIDPSRGEHRVHVASAAETGTVVQSLTLARDQRDREGEEAVASRLILNALAEAFAVPGRLPLPLLPGETVLREEQPAGLLGRFLAGEIAAVCVEPDGQMRCDGPRPAVLLPGSFNPLHEGHCRMAAVAAQVLGQPAAFELSAANVEKPPLNEGEVRRRMAQFAWRAAVADARFYFVEKARLFPGAVFVVGVDTAVRIVQPRFYGDSVEMMRAALDEIRRLGGRFLVAGRLVDGRFVELEQAEIGEEYRDLFRGLSEESFRMDVSSTEMRAAKG